jgi:predicted Zn-dependent protease
MFTRSNPAQVVAAFALLFSSALAPAAQPKDFRFTPADEKLWNECEAIDRQFEKEELLFNDPALNPHLKELAKPILSLTNAERIHWEIRVLGDPSANAFALPNGSIYVHTGLLALLESDSQLAGILAREIAHVVNRDAYLQFRHYRKKMIGRDVGQAAMAAGWMMPQPNWVWGTGPYSGTVIEVVGGISEVALSISLSGYSSELEREADTFAVDQMSAEGYDPMDLAKAFRLLDGQLEVELVPTSYSDHAKLERRIAYVNSVAKDKPSSPIGSPSSGVPFAAIVEKALRYNVQADIDSRRFRTAVAGAQHLVRLHPEDAEDAYLLGEAYRALGPRTIAPSEKDLTGGGMARAKKKLRRQTVEEEEKELLSRPDGPTIRKTNQEKSEAWYMKAETLNSSFASAYRGVGMLYEDQGKWMQAQAAYRKYLELAPEAADGLRVQRRIDALDRSLKESAR